MNPLGPQPERRHAGIPGYIWWRAITIVAVLTSAASVGLSAYLFARQDDAIETNRNTLCGIASFLTGAPLIRIEGVPRRAFIGQLLTTQAFLEDVRALDCPANGGVGRPITIEAIDRQLEQIRERIEQERRRGRARRARNAVDALLGDVAPLEGATATTASPGSTPPGATTAPPASPEPPPGSDPPPGASPPQKPPQEPPPPSGPIAPVGEGLGDAIEELDQAACGAAPALCPRARRH